MQKLSAEQQQQIIEAIKTQNEQMQAKWAEQRRQEKDNGEV